MWTKFEYSKMFQTCLLLDVRRAMHILKNVMKTVIL